MSRADASGPIDLLRVAMDSTNEALNAAHAEAFAKRFPNAKEIKPEGCTCGYDCNEGPCRFCSCPIHLDKEGATVSEIFRDDEGGYWERFHCDCMMPTHALDVEADYSSGETTLVLSTRYIPAQESLRERLVGAWRILRGQPLHDHDFILPYKETMEFMAAIGHASGVTGCHDYHMAHPNEKWASRIENGSSDDVVEKE